MSGFELQADPALRDQHIEELTGLKPYYGDNPPRDNRPYISNTETADLISRVKQRDQQAMQQLVASRLIWIYEAFAPMVLEKGRHDLELTDVMQIGCIATIQAAKKIDPENNTPINSQLHIKIPYEIGQLIEESALKPIKPKYGKALEADTGMGVLREATKDMAKSYDHVQMGWFLRRYKPTSSIENEIFNRESLYAGVLSLLDERSRQVIERRFGLGGQPRSTLVEIGNDLGVTQERVRQLQNAALRVLSTTKDVIGELSDYWDDQTNYGSRRGKIEPTAESLEALPPQLFRHKATQEKLMKQEIWLKEIRRKQQLGGIAFVKGDLLVRRLPDELEEYLEIDFSEGLQGYIQSPKSRLNKIMQELYG